MLESCTGVDDALERKRAQLHELQDGKLEAKEPHVQIKEIDQKIARMRKNVESKESDVEKLEKELEEAKANLAQRRADVQRLEDLREKLIKKECKQEEDDVAASAAKLLEGLRSLGQSVDQRVFEVLEGLKSSPVLQQARHSPAHAATAAAASAEKAAGTKQQDRTHRTGDKPSQEHVGGQTGQPAKHDMDVEADDGASKRRNVQAEMEKINGLSGKALESAVAVAMALG